MISYNFPPLSLPIPQFEMWHPPIVLLLQTLVIKHNLWNPAHLIYTETIIPKDAFLLTFRKNISESLIQNLETCPPH